MFLKICWWWNFNWWFVFKRPLGKILVGSNIDVSYVCFILWLCSFPCGPGSTDVIVCPCGPGLDEVDVLSVRPRFRRSRCFIRAAPVQMKYNVCTSFFVESNRLRFVILLNKMRMRKLFLYILLFFKSWLCLLFEIFF